MGYRWDATKQKTHQRKVYYPVQVIRVFLSLDYHQAPLVNYSAKFYLSCLGLSIEDSRAGVIKRAVFMSNRCSLDAA